MKICYIADANSIHARRWIEYFCKPKNEVHVISTTVCTNPIKGCTIHNLSKSKGVEKGVKRLTRISLFQKIRGLNQFFFVYLGLLLYRTFRFRNQAKAIVEEIKPDLVHCLRLPIEGYIGGLIGYQPMALSTWGNDMVYFARKYLPFRWLTKKMVSKMSLYFPDSHRDKHIAHLYGSSYSVSSLVIPVTGGLKFREYPMYQDESVRLRAKIKIGIDPTTNLVISVRGFKWFYVNTETLVKAIPHIIDVVPNILFVLKGDVKLDAYNQTCRLVAKLGIEDKVKIVSSLTSKELATYLTASDIMVSVTTYDGCPISMLEGMAYGMIPIMSKHAPIQEWIKDGDNGYLIDPDDPKQIAETFIKALKNKGKFHEMKRQNWDIIKQRADYYKNMKVAEQLYEEVRGKSR